jgi:hypothetical protein
MAVEIFLAGLAGITLVAVLVFAVTSKRATEEQLDRPDSPKSALAKDGPTGRTEDRL